jgi:hypothetical protein
MFRFFFFCYSVLQIVDESVPFALVELCVKEGAYMLVVLMLLAESYKCALITCEVKQVVGSYLCITVLFV